MNADIGKIIIGKMREDGISQEYLARAIGITQQAFSNKAKGKSQFTYWDLIVIFSTLDFEDAAIIKLMRE